MKKVLVIGANGQLGKCIRDVSLNNPSVNFLFTSREILDIQEESAVSELFKNNQFDYCINTAAYTNVEKAESNPEIAFSVNADAVKNIAKNCQEHDVVLIHISTDYVFDGKKKEPYTEEDKTNPINVYGASKLKGEQYIQEILEQHFILRTSWLYSQYGHNFLNTILKYATQGKELTITTEQIGTPTNANDLAEAILQIIEAKTSKYGTYHYSNTGEATWYDFAKAIVDSKQQISTTNLAKTNQYRTFAARPKYSVLNNNKGIKAFGLKLLSWQESLRTVINK